MNSWKPQDEKAGGDYLHGRNSPVRCRGCVTLPHQDIRHIEHGVTRTLGPDSIAGLLAAPSIFIWQRVARRLGMFPALRLAYGLEAVGVLLAGFGTSHVALVAGGALLGATFMGITALGLIAAREVAGNNQDRAIGWMTAAFGLGQLLGPAVAGHLAQITQGFETPSLLAALLLIAGIALLRDAKKP